MIIITRIAAKTIRYVLQTVAIRFYTFCALYTVLLELEDSGRPSTLTIFVLL